MSGFWDHPIFSSINDKLDRETAAIHAKLLRSLKITPEGFASFDPELLDSAAILAIERHRSSLEALPGAEAKLLEEANYYCHIVVIAACCAPLEQDRSHHVDRIVKLAEYRVPGRVEREAVARTLDELLPENRMRNIADLFDGIAAEYAV